jgi:hypothetical protein
VRQIISVCLMTAWLAGCAPIDPRPADTRPDNMPVPSGFVIEGGEPVASAFVRLGARDQSIYILAEGADLKLPGRSAPIQSLADLVAYLRAYGYDVAVSVKEAPYIRVKVARLTDPVPTTVKRTSAKGCAPLASIRIESASFRDNSLSEVMNTILADSGWSWQSAGKSLPKVRITATDVSDSVDRLLPQLLGQLGIPYAVRDCRIVVGVPSSERSAN